MKQFLFSALVFFVLFSAVSCRTSSSSEGTHACADRTVNVRGKVLLFTKTAGFRHGNIPAGISAIRQLGSQHDFDVIATEEASLFTPENLAFFDCVVFFSTTGDVLNETQQKALEGYIQSGGGFVGIHAATDTEYNWPWYTQLVGGQFANHPKQQQAGIDKCEAGHLHPSTEFLPDRWERFDEWYNFKNLSDKTTKLLNLDETSYQGGTNGKAHPIAWYHEFDGGRAWYTAGGHTEASLTEPLFMRHVLEGIRWAGKWR